MITRLKYGSLRLRCETLEIYKFKILLIHLAVLKLLLQVIGFALALISVLLATFFSSAEASSFGLGSNKDNDEYLSYPPDFFHAIYMLASAYVAMLFISWNLSDVPGKLVVDKGWISCWFHMASQWLSYILYIWILIAPRILRGREFDSAV